MTIRISSKDINTFSYIDYTECKRMASSGQIVAMLDECNKYRTNTRKKVTPPTPHRIFIARDHDTPKNKYVGWCVILMDLECSTSERRVFEIMLYVKCAYRRKGIGKKLYNRARNYYRLDDEEISIHKTDQVNNKFFDSVRNL
jgi:GNAT superfamily N-acetyltransferase